MLGILACRSINVPQQKMTGGERAIHKLGRMGHIPTRELENLFALRRMAGNSVWPARKLAERFGFDETTVDILLRYYNTPEIVGTTGSSDRMEGIWIEDLVTFRGEEARGKGSVVV